MDPAPSLAQRGCRKLNETTFIFLSILLTKNVNIQEDLVFCKSMKSNATNENVFIYVDDFFKRSSNWSWITIRSDLIILISAIQVIYVMMGLRQRGGSTS